MDNLISKWKATVNNHNMKLKNLREESLTRSLSRERTAAITASSLLLQSKAAGSNQPGNVSTAASNNNEMSFCLQNQRGVRRRRPRIDASSSSESKSPPPRQQIPVENLNTKEEVSAKIQTLNLREE